MTEAMPLSKERRAEIEAILKGLPTRGEYERAVKDLLAAERYWRETVKSLVPVYGTGGTCYCTYCNGSVSSNSECKELTGHGPDCAWRLANSDE